MDPIKCIVPLFLAWAFGMKGSWLPRRSVNKINSPLSIDMAGHLATINTQKTHMTILQYFFVDTLKLF